MKIHLIRHAEAVERSREIEEDHRFLTPKGRNRFREVAAALAKLDMAPDLIISSPLVRAVQTADILAEGVKFQGELLLSSRVGPGFKLSLLEELIRDYPHTKEMALVGHEPDFGLVVAPLLGLSSCSMKKGMCVSFKLSGYRTEGAEFIFMVTGGGKAVKSRDEAVQRLTGSGE